MSNPLIRWTLGKVSDSGLEILLKSIDYWSKIYPQFDRIVCCNNAKPEHIKELTCVEIFDQIEEYNNNRGKYYWKPFSTGWKLYPPRLRFDSHEIFCDNDLILLNRCDIIDEFLNSEGVTFVTSAIGRRPYGNFNKFVPRNLRINTGLFGVPPLYDLGAEVEKLQKLSRFPGWRNFFDEQGLIASILSIREGFKIIAMEDIYNCFGGFKLCNGVHFCGANAGRILAWESFKKMRILYL